LQPLDNRERLHSKRAMLIPSLPPLPTTPSSLPHCKPSVVEGKAAVKDYVSALLEAYPTRHIAGRQGSTRVYANDTIVLQNAYFVLTLTDKSGNVSVHKLRGSMTWLKMDNQWRILDQRISEANGADRS